MSLPADWVDRLFTRLTVRYGASFMRQYEGVDIRLVHGDWALALSGFSAHAIAYGLEHLPADFPPNALKFRDLCRKAPEILPPALPAPAATPEKVAKAIASIGDKPTNLTPAQMCIRNINAAKERALLTAGQRWVLECCEKMQAA